MSKRNFCGPTADTQQAKKRRFQTESKFAESKLSNSESEPTRGVGQVPGKSIAKVTATTTTGTTSATTSSIVDAATSLAQSPNLLKKVMRSRSIESLCMVPLIVIETNTLEGNAKFFC